MRGQGSFAPQALDEFRRAVPREDRPKPGLSVDELAARVGISRQQVLAYLHGRTVPEPARLKALASAVGVHPRELTCVPAEEVDLAVLRRQAGLTLKTAAARARTLLVRPVVRCSHSMLSELEAGRLPFTWRTPEVGERVMVVLAEIYAVPIDQINSQWPTTTTSTAVQPAALTVVEVDPPPAPAFRLVGPSIWTWYARCPSCELVAPPGSGSYTMRRDKSVDWSRPAELRCSQCGVQHLVTPFELQPHDAEVTCVRATCGQTFAAPSTAVEATCEHCSLVNRGPAALADPGVHHQAATVRYGRTLEMQARLAAAKDRARDRGLDPGHVLLLGLGE
ncbi:helix-turn-helix domain-containing protein (plasmid) [Lentzea sp. JNUCC 0626]|uniref:helix-turn-helix domain-containing protein n=1 Tax=Lentzea sp. JNUCC 0626 TaxID=3367513 RepID=UPI0037478405